MGDGLRHLHFDSVHCVVLLCDCCAQYNMLWMGDDPFFLQVGVLKLCLGTLLVIAQHSLICATWGSSIKRMNTSQWLLLSSAAHIQCNGRRIDRIQTSSRTFSFHHPDKKTDKKYRLKKYRLKKIQTKKYRLIYPSHGYTVLGADEIFKKYQAILACRGSLGTYRYM